MIAAAKAMVVRVELGIQQGIQLRRSNSYLEKLLIMLSGSFRPQKHATSCTAGCKPLWATRRASDSRRPATRSSPACWPPTSFPTRCSATIPTLARRLDRQLQPRNTASNTQAVERALRSLELCVVVDVAMTETAQFAHYVLPASFPIREDRIHAVQLRVSRPIFHVRAGILPPLEGTLPEPEIYTRLAGQWFSARRQCTCPFEGSGRRSRPEFAAAFSRLMAENRRPPRSPRWCSTIRSGRRFQMARRRLHHCGTRRCSAPNARRKR